MLLLFGIRTRERVVSAITTVCAVCGMSAAQPLVKRTTKFTLFFVPLFPVRPSTYHVACPRCGTIRQVDAGAAARRAYTSR